MTAPTLPLAQGASAALDAFLRQIAPRAGVFAELLCGDTNRGDEALALAMRAFRNAVAREPIGDWSLRFWGLLLAVPHLRAAASQARWPAEMASLAGLPTGQRAVLLLRLVAALDEASAAAALGVALPSCRAAFQRALPRQADGRPDADAWHALTLATQSTLQQLPAGRLVRFSQLREQAIHGYPNRSKEPARHARVAGAGRRWQIPALLFASVACAIALSATFFSRSGLHGDDLPLIQATPLPAAAAPVATYDADTALLTHPDFDQLSDARQTALVDHLDFYAWYAAHLAAQPGGNALPLVLPDASAPLTPQPHGAR